MQRPLGTRTEVLTILSKLKAGAKVVGAKQVRRAVDSGRAALVFVADDADPRVTEPVAAQAQGCGVSVCRVATMRELGEACGIAVGSAVAAVLR